MAVGGDSAACALGNLLSNDKWGLCVLAAEGLGLMSCPEQTWTMRTKEFIAAQLSKCLDHPHWWVRRSALQSAGRLQIVRTAPQIAKCLRDTEFLVRRNACLCVAQLCKFDEVTSPDVLRQLSLLVDDDDRYNRRVRYRSDAAGSAVSFEENAKSEAFISISLDVSF